MAFLDFLKRKKEDTVDIPPPPPPDFRIPGESEQNKPVHDISDLKLPDLPDLPEMEPIQKVDTRPPVKPSAQGPKIVHHEKPVHHEHTPIEHPETPVMPASKSVAQPKEQSQLEPKPNFERTVPAEQKTQDEGPIYIKASHYTDVLHKVDTIMSKIKVSERVSKKLNDIKNEKDQEFDKFRQHLEEIQKNIAVIDKTLFR